MAADPKSPVSLLNYIELVLSIIIAGLIANFACFSCGTNVSKNQFIDAGIYGYLIVNIILVVSIFIREEVSKNVRLVIAALGFLVYLTAGALILEFYDKNKAALRGEYKGRPLAAGILSIFLCPAYLIDLFLVLKG